jgi:hypothetical protein
MSGMRAVGERVFDFDGGGVEGVISFGVGCLDFDPTGEVVIDGAFDGRKIVGDLDGLLWLITGDAERVGPVWGKRGDGVMDGLTGPLIVGGLKIVGAGAGTISPFSQIDSGTDSISFTFNPAPASLSFNKDMGPPPTSPSATDTCELVLVISFVLFNGCPETLRIKLLLRFRRNRRVFRCAARELLPR